MIHYLYSQSIYDRLISYKATSGTFLHPLQRPVSKEKHATNLQSLPNEILLDLFDYCDGVDLLRAFYDLNYRFNLLLYKQFRGYRFNFSSISKGKFDMICQQHLPFLADRVIMLNLSDYKETPGKIDLFFSYIPSITQFTHLRYLTCFGFSSYETLLKLLDECQHLYNLTHLDLNFYSFSIRQVDFELILDNIWSLPKLSHFNSFICINRQKICTPTKICSTLECVHINGNGLYWNQMYRLFEYTPRLKHLSLYIKSTGDDDYIPSPLPTLVDLNISVSHRCDVSKMILLLQNVPNLRYLHVTLYSKLMNGYQWEQVIRNYLPKLKIFKLKMNDEFPVNQNIQERADELINSFRSSFWIDEHKWFVRYHLSGTSLHLFTLSNPFHYYYKKLPDSWKSTCPHDNQQKFYSSMTNIRDDTFFDQLFPFDLRLPNIKHLRIKFPINDQFWSIVPTLKQLYSLRVSSYTDTFQSQLQNLLDRAPHLYDLDIRQDESLPLQMSLFKHTNASVRTLDLKSHQFNEEECITLNRSSLGVQCQILSIKVKNRESIIILVKNMINLRALHVQCKDVIDSGQIPLILNNGESRNTNTSNQDDLVQWLKDRLPLTCFISKDLDTVNRVQIWI